MTTPSEVYDDAKEYAGGLKDDASRELLNARSFIDSRAFTASEMITGPFTIDGITKLDPPKDANFGEAPNTDPIEFNMPRDADPLGDILSLPGVDTTGAPVFTEKAPVFKPPSTPSPLAGFNQPPPSISGFTFPSPPPQLDNPVLETINFAEHKAPDAPTIGKLPELSAQPLFDVAEPTNLAENFRSDFTDQRTQLVTLAQAYTEEMIAKYAPGHKAGMARLEAKLEAYMAGGTGLAPAVEDAIYARARSKNDAEARRVRDQALADAATRGFTLPTGALMSATQQARQAGADNNAAAAAEIVKMQAELEQKNTQFAITASANIRTTVLQLATQWMQALVAINGQALDAAKAVMAAILEAYNGAVRAYTARLDAWKAEVALLDARVKIILADVEVYKGEITVLQAEYQVDQMKVDRLKAEVGVLMSLAEVYKTRVEAVVSQAGLEKLKLEVYQGQVQAFGATVQAKNAEWQGYTAQVNGYTAEAQAFGAQAQAFTSEMQGYKSKVDGQTSALQATVAANQGTVDAFKSGVQAFSAKVQAETGHFQGNLQTKQQAFSSYKAKIEFATAEYNVQLSYYAKESERILREAQAKFDRMAKKAEIEMDGLKLSAQAAIKIGDMQGNMAQAALSGLNALAVSTETF